MLKQALKKSSSTQNNQYISEIYLEEVNLPKQNPKTSLLTQIFSSSQKSSNRDDSCMQKNDEQEAQAQKMPSFVDKTHQQMSTKLKFHQFGRVMVPKSRQIHTQFKIMNNRQKKISKRFAQCGNDCNIY